MNELNLFRSMHWMNNQLVILIGNQEGAHIGCCLLGEPYKKDGQTHVTISTINRIGHKDDVIARLYVKEAVLCLEECVCCICGIHYDKISDEQMKAVISWCKADIIKMKTELQFSYKYNEYNKDDLCLK